MAYINQLKGSRDAMWKNNVQFIQIYIGTNLIDKKKKKKNLAIDLPSNLLKPVGWEPFQLVKLLYSALEEQKLECLDARSCSTGLKPNKWEPFLFKTYNSSQL